MRRSIVIGSAGASAAALGVALGTRHALHRPHGPSEYQLFVTRLRLSHEALRRNVGLAIERVDREDVRDTEAFGRAIQLFGRFLVGHHEGEDLAIFPALRAASPLRTSDAAHLTRWTGEHRRIDAAGQAMVFAARAGDLSGVRRAAADLRALLAPHLESEESVLNAVHLPEMIGERELARAMRRARRHWRGLDMALFLAHSLRPAEQQDLFVDAPWVFRRVILPRAGRTRFRDVAPYLWSQELRA